MVPTFDFTIHISDVAMLAGVCYALIKARDAFRDLANAVGSKVPPEGLLGDMEAVKHRTSLHHDWLIIMREKLGFKVNNGAGI